MMWVLAVLAIAAAVLLASMVVGTVLERRDR